ncbi:MAG: hypothetical protein NWE88_09865 [Candidatus Bathyarchaeota archaeon]|nr:hypothetical protein [Candidatus Bathyarchaeota archaeon]
MDTTKLYFDWFIESKANRMFWIFKPHEIIQFEHFDLEIILLSKDFDFLGGFVSISFKYPDETSHSVGEHAIPPLKKGEKHTIFLKDKIMAHSGVCGLVFSNFRSYRDAGDFNYESFIFDDSGEAYTEDYYLTLPISGREELYQKYSVIIAIFASVLSIIISTASLVISLFYP